MDKPREYSSEVRERAIQKHVMLPRVHLAAGPDGTVLEHWFGWGNHLHSDSWDPDLPLVRWFDRSGNLLSQGGRLRPYRGRTFTAALNWGFVAYARDTLWFARAADATVLAAPVDRMSGAWAAAERLPVAYKMERPLETTTPIGVASHVQRHLTTFALDPTGTVFVFGQVLAWGVRPATALGVYHRPTGRYRTFDLGGEIYEVRVPTPELAVVLHRDTTHHRRVVRAYTLPDGSAPHASPACQAGKSN